MCEKLKLFLRTGTPTERETVARSAGTSVIYLYQIAAMKRRPGIDLAYGIEQATKELHRKRRAVPVVTMEDLAKARAAA